MRSRFGRDGPAEPQTQKRYVEDIVFDIGINSVPRPTIMLEMQTRQLRLYLLTAIVLTIACASATVSGSPRTPFSPPNASLNARMKEIPQTNKMIIFIISSRACNDVHLNLLENSLAMIMRSIA